MFVFACPRCHAPLEQATPHQLVCPADGLTFHWDKGVWRMLLPERQAGFQQFVQEYETVRRAEGRGSPSAAYYRALPYHDLSGKMTADWRIRAASFDVFLKQALVPCEGAASGLPASSRQLTILDLGAGNGWLSNRLAARGHQVAAVDLASNDFDGLGCYCHYETAFLPVQAEFDFLPFADQSVNMAVFNASFHYAACYEKTLQEARRVIAPDGRIVILDTPFYHDQASGEKMVRERQEQFVKRYGFPSNALHSENYLTYRRLDELANELDLGYQVLTPFYGIGWALRPWKARLLGRREPAKFHVVVLKDTAANAEANA